MAESLPHDWREPSANCWNDYFPRAVRAGKCGPDRGGSWRVQLVRHRS
jgi:hypothetical protein